MNKFKTSIADLYLSWANDFLSVARFAEYYGLEFKEAVSLIDMGRNFQNQRAIYLKAIKRKASNG